MLLLMLIARWRCLAFLSLVLLLAGCRTRLPETAAPAPAAAQSSTPTFHFVVRPIAASQPVTILLDGKPKFTTSGSGAEERFSAAMSPGWHEIITRGADGRQHRAMVQADRNKWIRIRADLGKTEGFRVHITEYPIE